jgi:hypothetical protein
MAADSTGKSKFNYMSTKVCFHIRIKRVAFREKLVRDVLSGSIAFIHWAIVRG